MSNGRKRKDALRAKLPIRHCAEGHCSKESRKCWQWASCSEFIKLIKNNKTAFDCPYYIP